MRALEFEPRRHIYKYMYSIGAGIVSKSVSLKVSYLKLCTLNLAIVLTIEYLVLKRVNVLGMENDNSYLIGT